METTLTVVSSSMPALRIEDALERRRLMVSYVSKALVNGSDFGVIPGTGSKPTLLKPGAEKLCTFFGLRPTFEAVKETEDWTGKDHDGEPFFYYWMRCRLIRDGEIMAEGDGACSSRESKYRYRQGERKCPTCGKSAIKRSKFPPRNNPSATPGWYCYDKAGGCGANFAHDDKAITEQITGRVLNPDVADQQNTILKMACKRSLIAATLIGVNASEFFTQDIEDLAEDGVIEGTARRIEETSTPAARVETAAAVLHPDSSTPDEMIPPVTMADAKAARPATIRTGSINAFNASADAFSAAHPRYQDKTGSTNRFQILRAAYAEGFETVDIENMAALFVKLEARALSYEYEESLKAQKAKAVTA